MLPKQDKQFPLRVVALVANAGFPIKKGHVLIEVVLHILAGVAIPIGPFLFAGGLGQQG